MNHRTLPALLVAGTIAGSLALSGCHQKQPNPAQSMKQGTNEFGAGALKKASGVQQVVADSAITTKIKAQLAADEGLSGSDIQVQTKNGVVTLSGTVADSALRKRAGQLASGTDGVKNVTNDIKVAPQD
ncbi:MAG TPA: BON domain-containing protein [Gammaproteobacteria bacterium]|nr:BON domain-containing protein [Gammaproteobacteria bacterium]